MFSRMPVTLGTVKRLVVLLALLTVLITFGNVMRVAAAAATRYVSPSGADTNNNCLTSTNPCKTISHALFVAAAGDTIKAAAGTYPEHIAFNKNVTVRGASLSSTLIDGGGVARVIDILPGTTVTLSELTIQNGKETGVPGGGISNAGTLTLKGVIATGNSAVNSNGGGIWNNGSLTVQSSYVVNNHADSWGGGIYNQSGTLTLVYSSISRNTATEGGGIYNSALATLKKDTLTGNAVSGSPAFGGGLDNIGGTVTLSEVAFIGNSSSVYGGGMTNIPPFLGRSNAKLNNVTFSANSASVGGGFANVDAATLMAVTFNANTALHGGGFDNISGTASLTNDTFSENSATGDGGGLENGSGAACATTTLTNVTFGGNSSQFGGGIYNYCGSLGLRNTIVAYSLSSLAANGNCYVHPGASITSLGHNLDSGNTCGFTTALHDLVNVDPLLEPLAPNGGYTETLALEASSPAINKGTNSGCPPTDQRGIPRPQGGVCDIGAYEFK